MLFGVNQEQRGPAARWTGAAKESSASLLLSKEGKRGGLSGRGGGAALMIAVNVGQVNNPTGCSRCKSSDAVVKSLLSIIYFSALMDIWRQS